MFGRNLWKRGVWIFLAFAIFCSTAVSAKGLQYQIIEYPGAIYTDVNGINDRGDIVGEYKDLSGSRRGFILKDGEFIPIDAPYALNTYVYGINNKGELVGFYYDSNYQSIGYWYRDGEFLKFEVPGSLYTDPYWLNDTGTIVGNFNGIDRVVRGFIYSRGKFEVIEVPGALATYACAVTDSGVIVGYFKDQEGVAQGFRLVRGEFELIPAPTAYDDLYVNTGSNRGDVAGGYHITGEQTTAGFVIRDGEFITVMPPEALSTTVWGINSTGVLSGTFWDLDGKAKGFIATDK